MKAISCKPDSIRRYGIKLQSAAFYCVQNTFIGVPTECVVFTCSMHAELIGEQKNVNHVG